MAFADFFGGVTADRLCCGAKGTSKTTTMETEPYNQKQRDALARMLVQAKERALAELESDSDMNDRVEDEVMLKLAEEKRATGAIDTLRKLRKEARDVEENLARLGFDCSDDSISLTWEAPKILRKALEVAQSSARKERELSLRKFDLAILGVWAAATADDARKIVEGLL
ncbi:MAG: hypothetical protein ABSH56_18255 [Bryobacteraceae bacterium]